VNSHKKKKSVDDLTVTHFPNETQHIVDTVLFDFIADEMLQLSKII